MWSKSDRSVAQSERLSLPEGQLESVAELANGDLRHALLALHFCAAGAPRSAWAEPKRSRKKQRTVGGATKPAAAAAGSAAASVAGERDQFRDMFRTIGKLLHRPAQRAKDRAGAAGAGAPGRGGCARARGARSSRAAGVRLLALPRPRARSSPPNPF